MWKWVLKVVHLATCPVCISKAGGIDSSPPPTTTLCAIRWMDCIMLIKYLGVFFPPQELFSGWWLHGATGCRIMQICLPTWTDWPWKSTEESRITGKKQVEQEKCLIFNRKVEPHFVFLYNQTDNIAKNSYNFTLLSLKLNFYGIFTTVWLDQM